LGLPFLGRVVKILIVEDHADTAEVVAVTVKLFGHLSEVALSFADALRLAGETHFDLALCDASLPDGNGCELFTRLNQLYPIAGIAVTGRLMPDDMNRYRVAGFAGVLAKPFTRKSLEEAIDRIAAGQTEPPKDSDLRPFI
jgi:CheY-like chemotaxis protein